ncbi:hypothetical protein ACNKHX_07890 [Shigella flexneri]
MSWGLTLWDWLYHLLWVTRVRCPNPIETAIKRGDLTVGAVFPATESLRPYPSAGKTNWLASPPLVVAYALAGMWIST